LEQIREDIITVITSIGAMNIRWLAIGDFSLYLLNIERLSNILEILVSPADHEKLHNVFSSIFDIIHRIMTFESHYYAGKISAYMTKNGLIVKIISDLIIKMGRSTIPMQFTLLVRNSKDFPFHGHKILVPPLEWIFVYYFANPFQRNLTERILKKMSNVGINFILLDEILKFAHEREKKKVLEFIKKRLEK